MTGAGTTCMNIFILGANGFIGSHLVTAILAQTPWHIRAIDLAQDKVQPYLQHPRMQWMLADITAATSAPLICDSIQWADVVLPLAAIATPACYVRAPLRIFELDF